MTNSFDKVYVKKELQKYHRECRSFGLINLNINFIEKAKIILYIVMIECKNILSNIFFTIKGR